MPEDNDDWRGRMRRIEERHEALTQSVEHLVLSIAEQDARQNSRIDRLLGAIERLTTIAESHERRLGYLEGGPGES